MIQKIGKVIKKNWNLIPKIRKARSETLKKVPTYFIKVEPQKTVPRGKITFSMQGAEVCASVQWDLVKVF